MITMNEVHTASPAHSEPCTRPQGFDEMNRERERASEDPESVESIAKLIKNDSAALYLSGLSANSPLSAAPIESLQKYVKDFLGEFFGEKGRQDPLLMTLAEQIILAKHMIAKLYCDGLHEQDSEARRVNIQLATTLTGELRRVIKEADALMERFQSRSKASKRSRNS